MCTHRGGAAALGISAGRTISAPAPQISEFYQNRLNQIDAAIRHEQITAALIGSSDPYVYKRAKAARRRIARLEADYDALLQIAQRDAQSGIGF